MQSGQKPADQKPPPKPAEQKPGEQKPGEQKPPKPGEQKPGERPVTTQPGRTTPPTRGTPQEERLNTSLDQLSAKIQSHQVQASDYDAVREALRQQGQLNENGAMDPVAQGHLQRLEQTLDSFDGRLKNQKLTPAHVDMLRQQVIDERLDQAVERWRHAAEAGKVTDEEFRAVSDQLARRAEVAQSFDPQAAQMRTQLQTRLQQLQARAATTPLREQDIADFRSELFNQRLDSSVANLEARAKAQDLTRAELAQMRGLLEDRAAQTQGDPQFADMHKRLGNALDALDQKVAAGQIDPAEVAKLRAMLIRNAREAGTPREPKPAPPANPGGK